MATATEDTGPGLAARTASNAAEFVRDRLEESDLPRSPAELADEYGCTSGHMRDVCSDLNAEGTVERVAPGQYTDPDGDTDGSDAGDSDGFTFDPPGTPADTEGSDTMPTHDEYQRQHSSTAEDTADGSAEGSDDPGAGDSGGFGSVGTSDGDADAPAAPLPMEPQKLAKILAVALVLWLLYRRLGGGDTNGADAADVEDDQDDLGGLAGRLTHPCRSRRPRTSTARRQSRTATRYTTRSTGGTS